MAEENPGFGFQLSVGKVVCRVRPALPRPFQTTARDQIHRTINPFGKAVCHIAGRPLSCGASDRLELRKRAVQDIECERSTVVTTRLLGSSMSDTIPEVLITAERIEERVRLLGATISSDFRSDRATSPDRTEDQSKGGTERPLILLGILKGALFFLADLSREISVAAEIEYMSVSSYGKTTKSSGVVRTLKDLDRDIAGADVLLVEDIVDTGLTLEYLLRILATRSPRTLRVCSLLNKPARRVVEVQVDYVGFTIPDEFVVGYGLDYDQRYRNLPYIASLGNLETP